MRTMTTGALATACGILASALLASGAAKADIVPPFKGNDTGGIIAYSLAGPADVKALALNHCAQYGKIVKLTGVQATYGGYISFECIWPRVGLSERPLRVRY